MAPCTGYALPALAAVLVGMLLALPWQQDALQPLVRSMHRAPEHDWLETGSFTRRAHTFTSQGTQCEGWIYLPKAAASSPDARCVHPPASRFWHRRSVGAALLRLPAAGPELRTRPGNRRTVAASAGSPSS